MASLCPRCKTAEKTRSGYCIPCHSAKSAEYRAGHPRIKRKAARNLRDPGPKSDQRKRARDGCFSRLYEWLEPRVCDSCGIEGTVEMHSGGEVLRRRRVLAVWLCHDCHAQSHGLVA